MKINISSDHFLIKKSDCKVLFKIMKICLLFLFAFTFQMMALNSNAQDAMIELRTSSVTIEQLINEIERQTDYLVVYSNREVDTNRKVDFQQNSDKVSSYLNAAFSNTDIGYNFENDYIVLSKKSHQNAAAINQLIQAAQQQGRTIKGTVTDISGLPLPGVTVVVKGTMQGTTTNVEGTWSLANIPDDATLVFSFVGMQSQEFAVRNQRTIDVTMAEETIGLEEVIAVGYGTVRKSDLTGAVGNIKGEDLISLPASTAIEAMQGRIAGVTIQSTNGDPGGSYKMRIRGATSINANSDPLIVVDGLVGGIMPLPEDIASIEILKDASASAIYGSRGANGVVMVTTKSGKEGKISITFNSYYSFQKEIRRVEVLNAREFAEYINEARGTNFFDLSNITTDTDWQDLIFQPGHTQNYQVSVSGGSPRASYYVSGIFHDQKGIIKTSSFNRYSLTTNLKFDLSDRIRLGLNSILRSVSTDGVVTQSGIGPLNAGVISGAQRFDPNQGILDEDGKYTKSKVGIAAFENPMATIDGREENNRNENASINLNAEVDIARGLKFNSTFGTIITHVRSGLYHNRISNQGESTNGQAQMNYRRNFNFLTEQYLNYNFNAGKKNNFVLTGGYSYQRFMNENFMAKNADFITDALSFWNLGVGTNLQTPASGFSESKIASFYGRVNYNFDNRYLLTLTSRYDGASQFAEGHKWSFFPSGAFSWNVHNEPFWPENRIVPIMKIRTSYGLTGNQGIGAYASLAGISKTFFVKNGVSVSSVSPSSIANKDLTWETTSQFNIGLDFGLLERRINLSADYYYKKTEDLLFNVPIPSFSGFTSRLDNLGSIENKGVELQVESRNLVGSFQWTTSFNVTLNRNKVLELPGGNDIFYSAAPNATGGSMETSILREGYPVGSFFGWVYEGVYQEGDTFIPGGGFETTPGGEKFANLVDDGVLDNQDRTIIGNPHPKAVWGLNNDLSYKGFYMNIFFNAFTGGDMLNLVKMDMDRLSGNSNATKDALKRWTPQNTDTNVPKATSGRTARVSSRFVEDGSFMRLKNISFGYDFNPEMIKRLKIRSARIYVSGQNLLTFTKYTGVDPEVGFRSSNVNMGLDFDSYPSTTSWTLGINLGF